MKKMLFCFFLLLPVVDLISCGKADHVQDLRDKTERTAARSAEAAAAAVSHERDDAVVSFVKSLSLKDKVCQLFIENLTGNDTFVSVESRDGRPLIPGGYLFFSYNIADSPGQIISFTDSINYFCTVHAVIPPFLALDQEGGTVNRLRGVAGPLPSAEAMSKKLTVEQAYRFYSLQAIQIRSLGFTVNLAPVAEVCTEENRNFLAGRSFGSIRDVEAYAAAAVNAYQNNSVASVLKHFPGNTNTDPHTGLPEIKLSAKDMEEQVITPFSYLFSLGPAGVLMSHARTAVYDPGVPSCLSRMWVTDTIRSRLGFNGLIMSDDIFMAALAENGYPPDTAVVKAVEAGIDCIMISEKKIGRSADVLVRKARTDPEFAAKIDAACLHVIRAKLSYGVLSLEQSDGVWAVRLHSGKPQRSVKERLFLFEKARRENYELYRLYFGQDNTGAAVASE
jgi:beta-N-acetylhexosaminidase